MMCTLNCLFMWCFWHWSWYRMLLLASKVAPLYSSSHNNWNEIQFVLCHVMSLASAEASHDATDIDIGIMRYQCIVVSTMLRGQLCQWHRYIPWVKMTKMSYTMSLSVMWHHWHCHWHYADSAVLGTTTVPRSGQLTWGATCHFYSFISLPPSMSYNANSIVNSIIVFLR